MSSGGDHTSEVGNNEAQKTNANQRRDIMRY